MAPPENESWPTTILHHEFTLWRAALLDLGHSLPVHGKHCEGHPLTMESGQTALELFQAVVSPDQRATRHQNVSGKRLRLAEAVACWCREGESPAFLLSPGKALVEATDFLGHGRADLTAQEIAFIEASNARDTPQPSAATNQRSKLKAACFALGLALATTAIIRWQFGDLTSAVRRVSLTYRAGFPSVQEPAPATGASRSPVVPLTDDLKRQSEQATNEMHAGEALSAQGRLTDALARYRASLAIRQRLVSRDPHEVAWQRDLADNWTKMADAMKASDDLPGALKASLEAEAIAQACARTLPENRDIQRDLFFNALNLGDLRLTKSDVAGALEAFRRGAAIQQALCEREPANASWRRDLAVSQQRVADALDARGDHRAALAAYQESLAIHRALVAGEPTNAGWRSDLVVAEWKIGDLLLAQTDADGALRHYADALAIQQQLVELDDANVEWQHQLAVAYERLGQAQLAKGDAIGPTESFGRSLAVRQRLLAQEPADPDRQHEVFLGLTQLGDAQTLIADFTAALKSYREALTTPQNLVASVQGQTDRQREQAETQDRIGQVLEAQNHAEEALPCYRAALAIYEGLVAQKPEDATLRGTMANVSFHLGRATARREPVDIGAARAALETAREILGRLRSAEGVAFSKEQAAALDDTTRLLTQLSR